MVGAHNSFTYLKPSGLLSKMLNVFARCQTVDLIEQSWYGDCLDVRIKFNKKGKACIKHGLVTYKPTQFWENLPTTFPNSIKYIRVIHETSNSDSVADSRFIEYCLRLQKYHPHVTFLGGNRKHDWKQLITFDNGNRPIPKLVQLVSSMAEDARWYEKICPILYTNRTLKKHKAKLNEYRMDRNTIYLLDFIHKYFE